MWPATPAAIPIARIAPASLREHPADATAVGPERHPDADLAGSAHHDAVQHPVQADRDQQQGQAGKGGSQGGEQPFAPQHVVELGLSSGHAQNPDVRIQRRRAACRTEVERAPRDPAPF